MIAHVFSILLTPQAGVGSFALLSVLPAALVLSIGVIHNVLHDYKAFLSLGPGGTPSTPVGYLRIKFLSLFALKDPYSPAPVPLEYPHQTGNLASALAPRSGPRPTVRGIAPHRQTDQRASPETFTLLRSRIVWLAQQHPELLVQQTSCLEKHGPGLFARSCLARAGHCTGEICHAHPSDGSLHLTLHPADAAIVMKAGWGERHPLGRGGWLRRFVPDGFVMVYAPRNEAEVEVVVEIIKAAAWWIGGVAIGKPHADTQEKFAKPLADASVLVTSCPLPTVTDI